MPSLLRFIFTLSRFIGLEVLICALYLFLACIPVPLVLLILEMYS